MIGAFLAWWAGELGNLLPAWLRQAAVTGADALVIAASEPLDHVGKISAMLRRNGKEAPLGQFRLGIVTLADLPASRGLPIVLRLPKTEFLEKTLVLPLAAQADLYQVLAFEMDRETPFKADEVFWNHRIAVVDRAHGQLHVRPALVPKSRLSPLMGALASAGIAPTIVEVADGTQECLHLPLDGGIGRQHDRTRRLLWPMAACCRLLGLGAGVTPLVRQSMALSTLDQDVRVGRSGAMQAEALRREIDRLSRSADLVGGELKNAGRPLAVLAGVTRILPDDTYLTEFELQKHRLTISGRSASAARLIGALAADGSFRNPAFAAPVTRLEAIHAEVFSITTDVRSPP